LSELATRSKDPAHMVEGISRIRAAAEAYSQAGARYRASAATRVAINMEHQSARLQH
jgi:hypothetical protein